MGRRKFVFGHESNKASAESNHASQVCLTPHISSATNRKPTISVEQQRDSKAWPEQPDCMEQRVECCTSDVQPDCVEQRFEYCTSAVRPGCMEQRVEHSTTAARPDCMEEGVEYCTTAEQSDCTEQGVEHSTTAVRPDSVEYCSTRTNRPDGCIFAPGNGFTAAVGRRKFVFGHESNKASAESNHASQVCLTPQISSATSRKPAISVEQQRDSKA